MPAQGYAQAAAYREAYYTNGAKDETVWQEASRLAHDPKVAARVDESIREMRIEEIDDARVAYIDMLRDLDRAREANNWTAVAQLTKMRLQFHGLLKDRLVVSGGAASLTDQQLITELAGDDKERRALVASMIGADSEDGG